MGDLPRAHRAEHLHVFLQHLGRARRHALEYVVLQGFGRAFERHRQGSLIDIGQQLADAGVGHGYEVFEGEHQVADGQRQLGVLLLDVVQNGFAGARLDAVQQVGYGFEAGITALPLLSERLQFLIEHGRDFLGHLGRELPHFRQAQHHRRPGFFRQRFQEYGSLAGFQVGHHNGDRLGMFTLEKLGQLLGVGPLQGIQVASPGLLRPLHLRQQRPGIIFPEGLDEQLGRVLAPSQRDVLLGQLQAAKVLQNLDGHFGGDIIEFRNFASQVLHFLFRQVTKNRAGYFIAEQHHQDGGFADRSWGSSLHLRGSGCRSQLWINRLALVGSLFTFSTICLRSSGSAAAKPGSSASAVGGSAVS